MRRRRSSISASTFASQADYIPEENQRLRMYKRVAGVETESQLKDVGAELQDRYGPPPPPVRNLLDYASLKLLCMRVGVNAIERKREFGDAQVPAECGGRSGAAGALRLGPARGAIHARRNAEVYLEGNSGG